VAIEVVVDARQHVACAGIDLEGTGLQLARRHGARRNANVDQRVLQQLYDWDLLPIGEITIAQQDP
jgi:hypothetical protein